MYVKISNFINESGQPDYKGLDIKKIKPFSQVYPQFESTALFIYTGEIHEHSDISLVTETEYKDYVQRVKEYVSPDSHSKRIRDLEEAMATLMLGGSI